MLACRTVEDVPRQTDTPRGYWEDEGLPLLTTGTPAQQRNEGSDPPLGIVAPFDARLPRPSTGCPALSGMLSVADSRGTYCKTEYTPRDLALNTRPRQFKSDIRLQRVRNIASQTALAAVSRQLGTHRTHTFGGNSQIDVLHLLRRFTGRHNATPLLDLSHCGVTDINILALAPVVEEHDVITHIDLTGNAVTDLSGPVLLRAVARGGTIEEVDLGRTGVTRPWAAKVAAACAKNVAEKARRGRAAEAARADKAAAALRATVHERLAAVEACEKKARHHAAREARSDATRLARLQAGDLSRLEALSRNRHRAAVKRAQKLELADGESRERGFVAALEALAIVRLFSDFAEGGRAARCCEETDARSALKRQSLASRAWFKELECGRFSDERSQRQSMEGEYLSLRECLLLEREDEVMQLKEEEKPLQRLARKREMERIEWEVSELRRKRQDELRIERELQMQHELAQRAQVERQLARDKEHRAECGKRASIERRESITRAALTELKAVERDVVTAFAKLLAVERYRAAAYRMPPSIAVSHPYAPQASGTILKHFTGGPASCVTEFTGFQVSHAVDLSPLGPVPGRQRRLSVCTPRGGTSPTNARRSRSGSSLAPPRRVSDNACQVTWAELAKAARNLRRAYNQKAADAAAEVARKRGDDWAPIFNRSRETRRSSPCTPCLSTSPRKAPSLQSPAKRELSLLEASTGGPPPSFAVSPSQAELEVSCLRDSLSDLLQLNLERPAFLDLAVPPPDAVFGEKLAILGGRIVVACTLPAGAGAAADALYVDDAGFAGELAPTVASVPGKLHEVTMVLPPGAPITAVAVGLNAVRYKAGGDASAEPSERVVRYEVSLVYPSLGDASLDKSGAIASDAPLSAHVTVTKEGTFPIAVLPPAVFLTGAPKIQFVEDSPPDKCCIGDCVAFARPCSVSTGGEGGRLVFQPQPVTTSFDGWAFAVACVDGAEPFDRLLLKSPGDDEIQLVEPTGPEGRKRLAYDGLAFAEFTSGDLKRTRDPPPPAAEPPAEPPADCAFTLRLFGPEARVSVLAKLVKRLRFHNAAAGPVEGTRTFEASLSEGAARSVVRVAVDVVGIDDPASMTLGVKKVIFRQNAATVPESLRPHLRQGYAPVLENVMVEDVDTDYFAGGSATVTLSGLMKGDILAVRPELSGIELECPDDEEDSERELRVVFNGEVVGTLSRDTVVFIGEKPAVACDVETDASGAPGAPALAVKCAPGTFARMSSKTLAQAAAPPADAACAVSLAFSRRVPFQSVQHFLRSVVFTSLLSTPAEGTRKVAVQLKIGPSLPNDLPDANASSWTRERRRQRKQSRVPEAEYTVLEDGLELKVAAPLFSIPASHVKTEYREGSGAVRLAPFEVCQEKESLWSDVILTNGCIWIDTVAGGSAEDVLNLRTADDVRIEPRKNAGNITIPNTLADLLALSKLSGEGDPGKQTAGAGLASVKAATKLAKRRRADHGEGDDGARDDDGLPRSTSKAHSLTGVSRKGSRKRAGTTFQDRDSRAGSLRGIGAGLRGGRRGSARNLSLSLDRAAVPEPEPAAAKPEAAVPNPGDESPKLSLRDRMRNKAQDIAKERALRKASLHKNLTAVLVKDPPPALLRPPAVADVYSRRGRVAMLVTAPSRLFLQFAPKGVTRRDLVALLKNVTYANVDSDPSILTKIVHVTLKTQHFSISQGVVQIDIQSVDDVTEVLLSNPRPRFRPNNLIAFRTGVWPPMLPGSVSLKDPDTMFLDGGGIVLESAGGGVKGDALGFMTCEQQKAVHEFTKAEQRSSVEARDGKLSVDGVAFASIEWPKGMAGTVGVRVNFFQNFPDSAKAAAGGFVTLELAAYVLSCVTFSTSPKIAVGQRTYNIRIIDPQNPVDGKQKLTIDVVKPIVALPQPPDVPHVLYPTRTVAVTTYDPHTLLDKITCHPSDGKKEGTMTAGYCEVRIVSQIESSGHSLHLGGFLSLKDGGMLVGSEFLGKASVKPSVVRIDFGWASKATMKNLQAFFTSVMFKAARFTPEDDKTCKFSSRERLERLGVLH
eukprot:gene2064-3156_t